jgi:hypothetical protein
MTGYGGMEDIFQLAGDEKKTTTSCIGFRVRHLTKKITSIPPYLHTPYVYLITSMQGRPNEVRISRRVDKNSGRRDFAYGRGHLYCVKNKCCVGMR